MADIVYYTCVWMVSFRIGLDGRKIEEWGTFRGLKTQTTESCTIGNTHILDMILDSPDFYVYFMFIYADTILCGWMLALTNSFSFITNWSEMATNFLSCISDLDQMIDAQNDTLLLIILQNESAFIASENIRICLETFVAFCHINCLPNCGGPS